MKFQCNKNINENALSRSFVFDRLIFRILFIFLMNLNLILEVNFTSKFIIHLQ